MAALGRTGGTRISSPLRARYRRAGRPVQSVICAVLLALGPCFQSIAAQEDTPELVIRKTVDNASPDGAQPVFFSISVTNQGRGPATGVIVAERLPEGLAIPDGLAAFTSSGYYDAITGLWEIGDIAAGAAETMSLPAIVAAGPQPPCLVNTATLVAPQVGPNHTVSASAVVRSPGVEGCADFSLEITGPGTTPTCGDPRAVYRHFRVVNNGPLEAYDVVLTVTETAEKVPGFALYSPGCSRLQCNWSSIPAGGTRKVLGQSQPFSNDRTFEHSVTATISIAGSDPALGDQESSDTGTVYPFTGDCGLPDYGGGSSGDVAVGGCFIATAAYGTPFDERIDRLRHFRDHSLARSGVGRAFIARYYRHSPPIAEYIQSRPVLRALVRVLLIPVLLAIGYPAAMPVALALCLTALVAWRRPG